MPEKQDIVDQILRCEIELKDEVKKWHTTMHGKAIARLWLA
jgi:hypothetical protein